MSNSRDDVKLGATGKFPQGKLTPSDEGELQLAIGVKDDKVVILFGKSVSWLGMGAAEARRMGEALIAHANALERGCA